MTNMNNFTLDDILNNKNIKCTDTLQVAGMNISAAQLPHIEANAKAANKVLTRLLAISEGVEVATVKAVIPIVRG